MPKYTEKHRHLFDNGGLYEFMEGVEAATMRAAEAFPADQLGTIDPTETATALVEEHGVKLCPRRTAEQPTVEKHEGYISVADLERQGVYWQDRSSGAAKGWILTFRIKFEGDHRLFFRKPPQYTRDLWAIVEKGVLQMSFWAHKVGQLENLKAELEAQLKDLDRTLASIIEFVVTIQERLVTKAAARLSERGRQHEKANETLASLGFPLFKREDAPKTHEVPIERKTIAPPRAAMGEYELGAPHYENVLSICEGMSHVLEKSPRAFAHLDESAIRFHFLVQLNGQYRGAGVGEAFNFDGKTDIYLRHEDKTAFVAECKRWKGPKQFVETIDQLFGYTTWRETKAAIFVFNRDGNPSLVVAQIPTLLRGHPDFVALEPQEGGTRFRARLRHPRDANTHFTVTVLVFDVPDADTLGPTRAEKKRAKPPAKKARKT